MATLYGNNSTDNGTVASKLITPSVLIVCASSCTLSILGSLVIFWTYYLMPEIRNFTRKLVVCLTVADFLTATGYLLGTSEHIMSDSENILIEKATERSICLVQSYITTYSSLVSFLLTIMTAVHIYVTVVKQPDVPTWKRLVMYNLVSWVVPGIAIAVAGSKQVLGATDDATGTGPWCWIKQGRDQVMWQVVTGKGWEITCYLVTTSLYVLLKLFLYIRHRHERFRTFHSSLRDEDQNFLYIWLIFYIIRLWGTIRFFISAAHKNPDPTHLYMKVLIHLQAAGDPAQAFCNFILFCILDETVRKRMCSCCWRDICTQRELKAPDGSDTDHLIPDENQNIDSDQQNRDGLLDSSNHINYGTTNGRHYDSDDAHSYNFNSPRSTPCFTQKLSPASFRSVQSDSYSEAHNDIFSKSYSNDVSVNSSK